MDSDPSKAPGQGSSEDGSPLCRPFITFRRYADAQVSSLLQSVIGLPSALSTQSSTSKRMGIREDYPPADSRALAWPTSDNTVWEQRKKSEQDAPGKSVPISVSTFKKMGPLEDERSRLSRQSAEPYNQLLSRLQEFPLSFSTLPGYLDLRSAFFSEEQWPQDFLAMSPYSPLYLEQQYHLRHQQPWRASFEDLLFEVEDEAERGYNQQARPDSEEPGDWLSRINHTFGRSDAEYRDRLLSRLGMPSETAETSTPEAGEEAETELDLYGRILRQQQPGWPQPPRGSAERQSTTNASSQMEERSETVTSSLTTTVRTTAADGSVHTTMVLKRRFADGREDSSETVTTTAPPTGSSSRTTPDINRENGGGSRSSSPADNQQQRGGWFWSD
ncbi:MAG: NADH pyrophosphatase [Chaenotheca gracillima]|nr:MAG: NADH pyrophosphatase [Chaenotheca gracillima]